MIRSIFSYICLIVGSLFLTACGTSSNSGGNQFISGNPPPPPPGPINYDTAEYRHNYGLDQIKAIAAYDKGATGKGVTVAVIDSGVDIDHPQIMANIDTRSTNIVTGNKDDLNDIDGHGTAVAGVIAAIRDPSTNTNVNTHGVAFDAKIMALNTAEIGSCESADGCTFLDSDIAEALDYARIQGVKIVNISLGGNEYNTNSLIDAYKRAVAAGMVIIIAAGNKDPDIVNDDLTMPEKSAAVAWASWANGQIIAAGAVDESSTITDFSHRAGEVAKNVYLVAGGDSILTLGADGKYFYYSGTSLAAPHISGSVALLMGAFPNLTGKEVVEILFSTATDLGEVGPDVIYGGGLINLEAAFEPKGTQSIAVKTATGETKLIAMEGSSLLGGNAFGGFSAFSSALNNSMMLDGYNRSYRVNLGERVFSLNESIQLESIIESRKGSRQSSLQLDQSTRIKFSWREDRHFQTVDENYFSNQNNAQNRNHDLRMKLEMSLGAGRDMTLARGLSLKEALEDYDQDEFLSIGKEDFMALIGRKDNQTFILGQKLNSRTKLSLAFGHGGLDWKSYNLSADNYAMMMRLDHGLTPHLQVGMDLGVMNEKGSVLGSLSDGAISLGRGAMTTFVNGRINWNFASNLKLFAKATYGVTGIKAADLSLVEKINGLTSASFSIGITGHSLIQKEDRLSFAVSQPLRVMGGNADISYVTSRDYDKNILSFTSNRISLVPNGREIDFELAYRIADILGAQVDINLLHQINPNHDSTRPDNSGILIRFGSVF